MKKRWAAFLTAAVLAAVLLPARSWAVELPVEAQAALLMERLSAAVPGARFFCEENNVHGDLGAEHVFVIDPIDGTMNFVRRMHHSCISVAYMSRGVLEAAAVYNPYMDELFTAVRGGQDPAPSITAPLSAP